MDTFLAAPSRLPASWVETLKNRRINGLVRTARLRPVLTGNNIDFAILQPFLPVGYAAAGSCDLDLNLTGKLSRPLAGGFLKLRDGSLHTKVEHDLLDSIQADILLSDTALIVNSLSATYQGVPLAANSVVRIRTLSWFEISLNMTVKGQDAVHVQAELKGDSIRADLNLKEFDLALIQPVIPGLDALEE